jgi:hypothetical protein
MSSITWTPGELSSDAHPVSGICWRVVEAQHRVSTMKLVDTVAEQDLVEGLIETSKPPVPHECRHLDYLLSTPFRYGALYRKGSRFRRAGMTKGVFYASEKPETAIAETAFWRLLFYVESPATPRPINPSEYTAFSAEYASVKSIDLTKGQYAAYKAGWTHVTDYRACQALADVARAAEIEIIPYASVRDPQHGVNLALLTCRAFAKPKPIDRQTWHIRLSETGVQAICEAPKNGLSFDRNAFAADPRI